MFHEMIHGAIMTALLLASTIFWGSTILIVALPKFVLRGEPRRRLILFLAGLGENWVATNDRILDRMIATEWDVSGLDGLRADGHYLIISNHISWVDIVALFRVFHRKSAFIRFFMKHDLIWFPIVGQACDALEFPFMKRYSADYLERHPEKRGEDLTTARRACRRYRRVPVTVLNFIEGTRFTREKQENQASPYRHLLRPRIGGLSFALAALGDQLDAMYDVTIAYPGHDSTFWQLVTNRIPRIVIRARRLDLPPEFTNEAITRPGPERDRFKAWVDRFWREKDEILGDLLDRTNGAAA
jgi:1-acyl-sn-glycerol-3-phosphate acyltransferase